MVSSDSGCWVGSLHSHLLLITVVLVRHHFVNVEINRLVVHRQAYQLGRIHMITQCSELADVF